MSNVQCLINFKGKKVEPVVTHHNDEVTIAFYQEENLILQVTADSFDLSNLPDALLKNLHEKTTDEWENESLALSFENQELKDQLENYEEKAQALVDKYRFASEPF
ncbi:hypothetical protein NNC19_07350 [Clostridium sp. SHJSY1]|uniref:hypothetical protein n=1 Tax=Clostridium sp. SHJSY1 TaxID=2942483 RepID=UPI0028759651|nr:hypothetical protein [Clostridium sp. SHJSY1]MDS0525490.1 hypothetical protein [Clostridium sp. SHJSY1]